MKPLRIISWEPRTVERMAECFVEYLATHVSIVVESLMARNHTYSSEASFWRNSKEGC